MLIHFAKCSLLHKSHDHIIDVLFLQINLMNCSRDFRLEHMFSLRSYCTIWKKKIHILPLSTREVRNIHLAYFFVQLPFYPYTLMILYLTENTSLWDNDC